MISNFYFIISIQNIMNEDSTVINVHEKNVEIESKINNLTKKVMEQISVLKN